MAKAKETPVDDDNTGPVDDTAMTYDEDGQSQESATAGLETEPVARPYSEAADPDANSADRHHGYVGDDPANVVDLTTTDE